MKNRFFKKKKKIEKVKMKKKSFFLRNFYLVFFCFAFWQYFINGTSHIRWLNISWNDWCNFYFVTCSGLYFNYYEIKVLSFTYLWNVLHLLQFFQISFHLYYIFLKWKRSNHKQSTRWQHVSRLKASGFCIG